MNKHANKKHRRQQERAARADLFDFKKTGSPSPVIVLTESQEKQTASRSCFATLNHVEKDIPEKCLRVIWDINHTGADCSISDSGLIVGSVKDLVNLPKGHPLKTSNLQFVGDVDVKNSLPLRPEAKFLIAAWRRSTEAEVEKGQFTSQSLAEVSAMKSSIVKEDGVTHHGSSGQVYAYGSHASYNSILKDPNLASISQYVSKHVTQKALKSIFKSENLMEMELGQRFKRLKEINNKHWKVTASALQ